MSIEAVAWALKQPLPGKHTAKLVLIALANHHNESTGECYPSKRKLMEAACCSEKTAERCLQWLEAHGWIKRVARHTDKGRRTTNTYLINLGKINGGQVDPLPQSDPLTTCPPPVPVNLGGITSLNRKCKPSAQARGASRECLSDEEKKERRHRLGLYRERGIWPPAWGAPPSKQELIDFEKEMKNGRNNDRRQSAGRNAGSRRYSRSGRVGEVRGEALSGAAHRPGDARQH